MALNDTVKKLHTLLAEVGADLTKSEGGNSAAAQRARTGTIKLEKLGKLFRKESVKASKGSKGKKKPAAKKKAPAKKKPAAKKKAAPKRKVAAKKKPAAKKKAPAKKKAAPKRKKR